MIQSSIYSIEKSIIASEIDNIIICLNIESGKYYKLSESGTVIFKLIESGNITIKAISKKLEEIYKINNNDDMQEELSTFLDNMIDQSILKKEMF